jgi:hypothetical protein
MKTKIVFLFLILFSNNFSSIAQIADNFTDGDFTSNPTWSGDSGQFIVTNGVLQLNSIGTDSSCLSLPYSGSTTTFEWNFMLRLNFSPSSSNYARFYLISDQPGLESPLNGYYLQFGESGSNDGIELFRQTASGHYSIGRGMNGTLANGFVVKVKVVRDPSGNWEVKTNYNGGSVFTSEISGTDVLYPLGNWCGIKCNYTSSNATKFYFDDFYAGPEILDLTPPALQSIQVIDSIHIDLHFDEPLENLSAGNTMNYSISNSIGYPSACTLDVSDPSIVHLTLLHALSNGVEYTLTLQNIYDLSGNLLVNSNAKFTYILPETVVQGDIIFNEIMPDPGGAPSLPDAEYIELFNRSSKYLSTYGWKLSDGSSTASLPADTLAPGDYRVYCSTASLPLLIAAGINVAKGVSSFPGLNNDGDELTLTDLQGKLLDMIKYDLGFYHDPVKSSGGWAIERIDVNYFCSNSGNWKASADPRGGTPGMINYVAGNFSDKTSPFLIHATVIDSLHIRLHFNKAMDVSVAGNLQNYKVNNGIGYPINAFAENQDYSTIQLTLSNAIQRGEIYEVNVSEQMSDCPGNKLALYKSAEFGIADSAKPGDVVINEILFNPKGEGSDFVEFYNRSDKVIDLSQLKLANADPITGSLNTIYPVISQQRLLLPGRYIALTENTTAIAGEYILKDQRTILSMQLPSYIDDEGVVVLLSKSLQELDRFHYNADMHFALLNDVEGISLERISPLRPSSDSTNWHSAAETSGFASPGYENSQYFELIHQSGVFNITPELFSPDNDGKNDVCNFNLKPDKPGYYASISIFNDQGILMQTIAENELLGASSTWSWDGFNTNRELAPIGIYVVYLQMVNPDGDVKHIKKPCVLGHRW